MARTEHIYVGFYQLTIILIRGEHIGLYTFFASLGSQCANDIVSLESFGDEDGDVHGLKNILNDGYGAFDVFRCSLPLRFIRRISLMAEGLALVEGHAYIGRMLLVEDLFKRIAETENGRCVESFGIYRGTVNERIIGSEDDGVGIQ